MAVEQQIYTVEEFEQLLTLPKNRDQLLELVNGEVREKVVTQEHGIIALKIGSPLLIFVEERKLGQVGVEIRHRLPHDRRNSRLPDVSFTRGSTPIVKKGAVLKMPDLAVEIQSPDDTLAEMREKAQFYLANGSKMVWLVYPSTRLVEVLTAHGEAVLTDKDTLDGGDVLPGFKLAVKDIFPA
jgi:Uma2 family endonuclease